MVVPVITARFVLESCLRNSERNCSSTDSCLDIYRVIIVSVLASMSQLLMEQLNVSIVCKDIRIIRIIICQIAIIESICYLQIAIGKCIVTDPVKIQTIHPSLQVILIPILLPMEIIAHIRICFLYHVRIRTIYRNRCTILNSIAVCDNLGIICMGVIIAQPILIDLKRHPVLIKSCRQCNYYLTASLNRIQSGLPVFIECEYNLA